MGAVQGTVGLPPSELVPRGLGTGQLESFSGYAARVAARIAVPTAQFVRRAFQDAADLPLRSSVVAAARQLNVGERDSPVAAAVGHLTGHDDLDRLSYFGFLDLFGTTDRGLLVLHRRWCSECWRADGAEPYERKVWWLGLVDVCHRHRCLLESRCPTCGRRQPTLPRAVRIQVCSYCGNELQSPPVVPGDGPGFDRMLWYAREAAFLVHVGEAIALAGSDERGALKEAYRRLAAAAGERELPAVQRFFADEIHRAVGSKVEALMSGLWRLDSSVLELFSPEVRAMVFSGGSVSSEAPASGRVFVGSVEPQDSERSP